MTDYEHLMASALRVRNGPGRLERLNERLRELYARRGSYRRLQDYLERRTGARPSRQWLFDHIGPRSREEFQDAA